MKKVETLAPFTKFCVSIGAIPSSYKESLTYEEQLIWLMNYLQNTVIPTVNNNAEALEEVQRLMVQLQEYVDNYFENLDVQEEINNKLDEMAENGTLEEIITSYINLKSILAFDTVSDMKSATNLINGSFVETYGFYSKNDGGNAKYKIRTITNEDIVDESTIIAITSDETLIAELVYNQILNVKTFGAKGDGTNEDTTIIQHIIDIANDGDTIYFPNGTYLVQDLSITKRLNLIGENSETINQTGGSTLLLADDNECIVDISGTNTNRIVGFNIKNINFNGNFKETNTLLNVKYFTFMNIKECSFNNVNGSAIQVACGFESGIYNSVFRRCGNETNGVIDMLNYLDSTPSNNINNFHIENCTFGVNSGNWIKSENSSNVDVLWILNNKIEYDNTPDWVNENNQAVIYLGSINRCHIKNNYFTNFSLANNKYTKIIECINGMGSVSIIDNKLYSCNNTTFITSIDPVIIAKDNAFLNCSSINDIDVSNSQSIHAYTPSYKRNTNGSSIDGFNKLLNYIESTSILSTSKHTLEYDSQSLNATKQVIKSGANTRIGYFNINMIKNMNVTNVTMKIRAKRKTVVDYNPSLIVYDGNTPNNSLAIAVTSEDWTWYNITLPVATIGAFTSDFNLRQNNVQTECLIDGYMFIL